MPDSSPTDAELLDAWLERRHEPSFHALVSRHAGLVHSAARRRCGNESCAAEASQLTFILLARKASSLAGRASLAGWLHLTAVRQAKDLLRQSQREQSKRARLTVEMEGGPAADAWRDVRPVIDDALSSLPEKDREALLLRYCRAMTVREIAATLGIGTDAAQKRIDRATERLRGKLVRSGCLAGGMSAGLLAGLSAEARATAPAASSLASKAIATAPGGTTHASATVAAKSKLLVASSVVLLLVAIIAASAHRSPDANHAARSSNGKEGAIGSPRGASGTGLKASNRPAAPGDRIDWQNLAARIEREKDLKLLKDPAGRVRRMSREELAAEYQAIRELRLSDTIEGVFLDLVMEPLLEKSVRMALQCLIEDPPADTDVWWQPIRAFEEWAKSSPQEAATWLEEAMASGPGQGELLGHLEQKLVGVLLGSDPEAAFRRIGNLPGNQRAAALRGQWIADGQRDACVAAIREHVPQEEQVKLFSDLVSNAVEKNGFADGTGFLNRIDLPQEDRASLIGLVANDRVDYLARTQALDVRHIDELRQWLESVAAERTDHLTGAAISRGLLGGRQFADLAELVTHYREATGNDEVVVGFLENPGTYYPKDLRAARRLAETLGEPSQRERILHRIDSLPPPK